MSRSAADKVHTPEADGSPSGALSVIPSRWTGPLLIGLLGGLLLLASVANFLVEFRDFGLRLPPLLAVLLGVLPSLGLIAIAEHVRHETYDARQRLVVAGACYAGVTLLTLLVFLTVLVRLAEGRVVAEPQFPLLVAAAVGGIAGSLVGLLLVRLRESAAHAERARERLAFVNSVLRHDVLNGIAVITARAELLAEEADADENVDAILSQGDQLTDLVERTRSLIRALDEDDAVAREPVDLLSALETQVDRLSQSHPAVDVELDVQESLVVQANDSLADVVWNVLTNAVDHHDGGEPRITVTAERVDGFVRLRIADDGPGILPDVRERLLEGGGGIDGFGLFFVRTMVEAWDGRLQIEDNDPRGTVVVIDLETADQPPHAVR